VDGDIVHFADFEFRVGRSDVGKTRSDAERRPTTVALGRRELPHRFAEGTRELRDMLSAGQVTTVFQPIVLLSRGTVAAYEALGRGLHPQPEEVPPRLDGGPATTTAVRPVRPPAFTPAALSM